MFELAVKLYLLHGDGIIKSQIDVNPFSKYLNNISYKYYSISHLIHDLQKEDYLRRGDYGRQYFTEKFYERFTGS